VAKKSTLGELAGFDDSLHPSEDPELFKRLIAKGDRLLYLPEMVVFRARRDSFHRLFLQFFKYAVGRAKHLFRGFKFRDLFFLIPALFVVYLLLVLGSSSIIGIRLRGFLALPF